MNKLRWIIALWFLDWALAIAPNDKSRTSLLLAIEPWIKSEVAAGALLLANRRAGKQ